jgi:hypothetical protein
MFKSEAWAINYSHTGKNAVSEKATMLVTQTVFVMMDLSSI